MADPNDKDVVCVWEIDYGCFQVGPGFLQGEWVREAAERSKRLEKNSWNPSNDVSKDLEAVSAFEKEKRELKKEEADSFAAEIAKQMKTKRMRAQYKTACVKASRYWKQPASLHMGPHLLGVLIRIPKGFKQPSQKNDINVL